MHIKRLFILIVNFFSFVLIYGQPALPKVVKPSPEASSLTKMFDYPVSNCTGVPDVSVPIFTITSGQLSVPISISNHASGRRVDDITGAIGLGWGLNAGGLISRTIYGDRDDYVIYTYPVPWKKSNELSNSLNYTFLAGVDNRPLNNVPQYDTEYDIFTYNANGLFGNFVLKDVANTKVPTFLQKKAFKINWQNDYFDLTDDNGNRYRFGKALTDGKIYHETSEGINSWMLTDIISPNSEDTIHFKYTSFTSIRRTYSASYTKFTNWTNLANFPLPLENPKANPGSVSEEIYSTQRLCEIIFKQGKVVFNLLDMPGGLAPEKNLMIKSIDIKNVNGDIIKKIELQQTIQDRLSDGIMPTYKLDKIIFKDRNLLPVETYSFEYYPTVYHSSSQVVDLRFTDLWGYYNASGKTDVCPFIPTAQDNVVINNPNADRNPNETAMMSGVLKKIIYPTGGSTEFFYEVNKYYDQGQVKPCGGLRIYQIRSSDSNNNSLLKTYRYGIGESGYGYLPMVPSVSTMSFSTEQWQLAQVVTNCEHRHTETQYFSNVMPIFSGVASKPVVYTEVAEYFGDLNNNTGKIVYTYDREDITPPTLQAFGSGMVNYRLWKRSDLLSKSIYGKVNDPINPYKVIKSLVNTYTETEYPEETIYGLRLRRIYFITPIEMNCPSDRVTARWCHNSMCYTEEFYASPENGNLPIYSFGDYTIGVGKKELTNIYEVENTTTGSFTISTTNVYDSNHQLKEQITTDSKNMNVKKEYLYPSNMNGEPYLSMGLKNMINPIIQVNEYNNNAPTFSTKTNYSFYKNNSLILPAIIETKKGNGSFESQIRYSDYDDRANILCVQKDNDLKIVYIYSYSQSYPIAKIENADYITVENALGGSSSVNNFSKKSSPSNEEIKNFLAPLYSNSSLGKALITSYTYLPLVGMTSQADPNGVTTYYDYDAFGRLKCIKDNEGNILKTYEYHYKE